MVNSHQPHAFVLILFSTFPGVAAAAALSEGGLSSQSPTISADGSNGSNIEWGPVLSSFACLTVDGASEEWNPDEDRRQRRVRIRSPSNASSLPDSLREHEQEDRSQVREREDSNASSLPWSLLDGQDERTRLSDEGKLSDSGEKGEIAVDSSARPPTKPARIMVPRSTAAAAAAMPPSTPASLERALAISRSHAVTGDLTPVAETNAEDGGGFFSDSEEESEVSSVHSSTVSGGGSGARKVSRDPAALLAAAVEKARQIAGIPPPCSRSMAHTGPLPPVDEVPIELPSVGPAGASRAEELSDLDVEGSDDGRPAVAATLAAEAMVAFENRKNKKVVLSPLPGKVDKLSKLEKVEAEADAFIDAIMEDAFGSEPRSSVGRASLGAMSTDQKAGDRTSWSSGSSFAADDEDTSLGEAKSQSWSGRRAIPAPASRGTAGEFSLMGALSAFLGGKRAPDPSPTIIDGSGSPRVSLAAQASPDVGLGSVAVVDCADAGEEERDSIAASAVMLASPGVTGGDSNAGKTRPEAGSAEEAFETAAAILRKRKAEEAVAAAKAKAAVAASAAYEKGQEEQGEGGGGFSLMGALSNFLGARVPEPAPTVVDGSGSPRAELSASYAVEQWPDEVMGGANDADEKSKVAAVSSVMPANPRVPAGGSTAAKQRPRAGSADEAFEVAKAILRNRRAEDVAPAVPDTATAMQQGGGAQSDVAVGGGVEEVQPAKIPLSSQARAELPQLVVKREDEDGELRGDSLF